MNIEQNPAALEQFQAAIRAKSWPAALDILAVHGLTARPSQAPKLRDAVRSEPALVATRCVQVKGSMRELVAARILEPDRDEHGGVITDWLTDPVRLEDTVPHLSTNWRAEYQIRHHVAFGDLAAAASVLRAFGLSCRIGDFDGALFRFIIESQKPRDLLRDGGTVAFATTN
jgi:hypothetical protein